MAILFERQRRPVNWFALFSFLFLVIFFGFAAYYLFFAPSPKIEAIIPEPLKRANQLSRLEFADPSLIVESAAFKRLRSYANAPGIGQLGRPNPFLPF